MAKKILLLFTVLWLTGCSKKEPQYPWNNPVDPGAEDSNEQTAEGSEVFCDSTAFHYFSTTPAYSGQMAKIPARGFLDANCDTAEISQDFWMDTAEVSESEWFRVMGDRTDSISLKPKVGINWFDAIRYCVRRSALEGFSQVYDTAV